MVNGVVTEKISWEMADSRHREMSTTIMKMTTNAIMNAIENAIMNAVRNLGIVSGN